MKKIPFLIALTLFSNVAYSETKSNHSYKNLGFTQLPTVSIGGSLTFMGALSKQEDIYSEKMLINVENNGTTTNIKNRATDDVVGAIDANLTFDINGINDYGLKYGAFVELNANSTPNSWNNDLNSTQAYIYGESFAGKLEIGNTLGASQKMKVDASTFARATGGISGKYLNFINLPSILKTGSATIKTPLFILIPELPTAHGGYAIGFNNLNYYCDKNSDGAISGTEETNCYNEYANENYRLNFEEIQNSTKISYYTPEIYGFQVGASYTPDTGNKGTSGYLSSKLDTEDIDEVIEYGITYTQTFGGLGVSLSFTGEQGKSESSNLESSPYKATREDLKAYQFGGNLSFWGLTIGGSMGNWENSLNYTEETLNYNEEEGKYITFGLAYEFGPVNFSFTGFNSEFQKNEYEAFSVGLDYKLAKGFMPYVEVTSFDFKPNETTIETNKGLVVLAGFLLNF